MALGNLGELIPSFFVGPNGERLTPDQIRQRQLIAASLRQQATDTSPNAGGFASILSKGIMGLSAGLQEGRADRAAAGAAEDTRTNLSKYLIPALTGDVPVDAAAGGSVSIPAPAAQTEISASSPAPSTSFDASAVAPEIKTGIVETANALGIAPADLATAISYETGGTFDPTKTGPTTQWGQHRGLIQFGEPQAKQYGVDWNNPVGSQLGANGAVANYLKSTGVKPGSSLLDIYSAINAGSVGRYNASDANNGGAPGTVADKVNTQMAGHRANALALLGDASQMAPVGAVERAPLQPVAEAAPLRDYSQMPQVAPSGDVNAPVNAPAGAATAAVANALTGAVKGGRLGAPQPLSDSSFNARFGGQPDISPQSIAQAAQPQPIQQPQASPQVQNAAFMPEIAGQSGVSVPQDIPAPAASPQLAASSPQPVAPVAPQQVAQNAPAQRQPLNIPQAQLPVVHPLSPAVIKTLSNPYASPEEQRIAGMLLQRYQGEKDAYQKAQIADQANRQEIQQRVGIADQLNIPRQYVMDADVWKQAVTKAVGNRPTAVVNGVLVNTETGEPIYGTPEKTTDVQNYEYGEGHPGFIDQQERLKRASASSVTVGGGSGTQIFDTMNKSADLAQGAATGLNAIREARKAVSGGIISGAGADERLGLQKIGAFLGVTDPTEITNTETFRAAIAPQISAVLHATAGTANLSDADREFATKAAGGSIKLNESSIKRILDIMEKAGTNSIKLHNSKVDKVYPEGKGFDRERALFRIDEPAPEEQTPPPPQQTSTGVTWSVNP